MKRLLLRVVGTVVVVVGLGLLARAIHDAAAGTLAAELLPTGASSPMMHVLAIALGIAVPAHVVAVGLVLQRRYLRRRLARASWLAALISGCWLGAAILIKMAL